MRYARGSAPETGRSERKLHSGQCAAEAAQMNELSLGFYCADGLIDLAALGLGFTDLWQRIEQLRPYRLSLRSTVTLMWNTAPDVTAQLSAVLGPEEIERRRREADNELRQAVAHISEIAGVWTNPGHLVWALLLLILGTLAGTVGNIAGAVSPTRRLSRSTTAAGWGLLHE
jgi:hypothetical protein